MSKFSDLGLSESIQKVLPELGIETPTDIQTRSIPLLLQSHQDFIGLAQTGTGKTAAFGLPLIDILDDDSSSIQALILAPTRELAQQIAAGITGFAKYKPSIKIECVYGGAAIMNQIKALKRKVHIVVATPGRLIDLVNRKALKLDAITHVVLDEADEMMNMGFKEELNKILAFTPESKSTWLFSATMPRAIRSIAENYMKNPTEVAVSSGGEINRGISHQFVVVKGTNKTEALARIIDAEIDLFGIVFCRTKMDTETLAQDLTQLGYLAEPLNGDLTQRQRDVVMKRFKSRSIQLLVATDVAARGIDVDDLTHVIHHRLPDELEFYTHRSGRTARAGKKGISLTLATKSDLGKIRMIEKRLKVSFEKQLIPTASSIVNSKVLRLMQTIAETEIGTGLDKEVWDEVSGFFTDMSKEDLLNKLLAMEMGKLKIKAGSSDINLHEDSGERQNQKEPAAKDMNRFFMNLGAMDDASKADIVELIVDVGEVSESDIGSVSIQNKCTFFEVKHKHAKTLGAKFDGLMVNGRELRVNLDDEVREDRRQSRSRDRGDRGGSGSGSGRRPDRRGGSSSNSSRGGSNSRGGGRRRRS